jgi:hypothetical protein
VACFQIQSLAMWRSCTLALICGATLFAQKYNGPQPEKPDLPYLLHADSLVATEAGVAKEESRKAEVVAVVQGATSSAATPLSTPIFVIRTDQLAPEKLEIYKMEVRNGQREVVLSRKKKQVAKPIRANVTRLADNLFKIEVDQSLQNGEYAISPSGAEQVFCFRVY